MKLGPALNSPCRAVRQAVRRADARSGIVRHGAVTGRPGVGGGVEVVGDGDEQAHGGTRLSGLWDGAASAGAAPTLK